MSTLENKITTAPARETVCADREKVEGMAKAEIAEVAKAALVILGLLAVCAAAMMVRIYVYAL